ncbi:putative O-methyltransferase [Taphrina deformans PYCC 5710]|uniref:O-methyltransferase n=1 Tax=Taphrina deformans (strain PYCC 5710 / ATCC 11124 / CBS 356.35 / IMI 108563 / JCM 9778 / NBRC 8474) TaxID=1097556 RepID=R4XFC3_TAPDE|nr:putative O-methyltransferase [Taphrina deformans PYCC 5710]|eukprot:CCG82052.1 putative O-methyltransferase [Taphrina deformans PYCC 5710]
MSEKDVEVKQIATNVVDSLAAIEESFRLAKLELLKKENELFKPLYAKREKLTSAVPHFWSTVLSVEDELLDFIKEAEADLLKSCTSFRVQKLDDDPRNFTISMSFSRNAYLENTSCNFIKNFKFDGGRLTSRAVALDWRDGKNLVQRAAEQDRLSFFSLFSFVGMAAEVDEMDIDEDDPQLILEDMAMLLVDEVYPHALSYFTDALLPPQTPAESPHIGAIDTSGAETPSMALESMTTSFLDAQERVSASKSMEDGVPIGAGKSHKLSSASQAIEPYARDVSTALPDFLAQHRRESIESFNELKMVSENEAQFLLFLASYGHVKRVLEIGCFTGYSAMIFAHAGAEEVVTMEIDPELASFAKLGIHRAGLSEAVKVVVGDAHKTILDKQSVQGKFDLIFIDAEKSGYLDYIKVILERDLLSRERGIIVADNTLRRGCVATLEMPVRHHTAESHAEKMKNDEFESGVHDIRRFNDFVKNSDVLESVLMPAWDGCTLLRYKKIN